MGSHLSFPLIFTALAGRGHKHTELIEAIHLAEHCEALAFEHLICRVYNCLNTSALTSCPTPSSTMEKPKVQGPKSKTVSKQRTSILSTFHMSLYIGIVLCSQFSRCLFVWAGPALARPGKGMSKRPRPDDDHRGMSHRRDSEEAGGTNTITCQCTFIPPDSAAHLQ